MTEKLKEIKGLLTQFGSRDEAIKYLADETRLPVEECASAYDFLVGIDFQ